MSAIEVIDGPAQADAQWLTAALRATVSDAEVTAVQSRPIGTGQMASTYSLELSGDNVPQRLVLKVASETETTRARAAYGYRAEIGFYRDLASSTRGRVPRCYLAIANDDYSRFSLLLEDVSPAIQGNQIAGATADVVTNAAINLAELHAATWCDGGLWDFEWAAPPSPGGAAFLRKFYDRSASTFCERFAPRLSTAALDTLRAVGVNLEAMILDRTTPFVAIHGDYRLDNLLISPTGEVTAVDWQTLGIGHPGRDLAFLITTSLHPDARRQAEHEIVAAYHRRLLDLGVGDYDLAACFDDYVFGMLQGPLVIVIGATVSDASDRGDDMFVAMVERTIAALHDHNRLKP